MRKTLVILLFVLINIFAWGQTPKWQLEGEILLYSKHVWRGLEFGETPSIEPSIIFSKGKFSITFWAAKTVDDSYAEIDIIPSLKLGNYEFALLDYYNPVKDSDNNYIIFKDGKNRHSTELAITRVPSSSLPLRLMAATFFFGDKNTDSRKPYFSTYLEAGIPFKLLSLLIEPSVGLTTHEGYYANKTAIINTCIVVRKEFSVTNRVKIPAKLIVANNPYQKNMMFSIGTGFCF